MASVLQRLTCSGALDGTVILAVWLVAVGEDDSDIVVRVSLDANVSESLPIFINVIFHLVVDASLITVTNIVVSRGQPLES